MSVEFEPDEINLSGYENFVRAVKAENPPYLKVGVLGDKVNRPSKNGKPNGPSNAEIGAAHEYGSPSHGLPSRSFLRMPLTTDLPKALDETDLFDDAQMSQVLKTGSLLAWLAPIRVLALGSIKKAFASNGFGKWAPWKPGYSSKTGQILDDEGLLKDSIDAVVVNP